MFYLREPVFRRFVQKLPRLAIWLSSPFSRKPIQWRYRSGFSPDSPSIDCPSDRLPKECHCYFNNDGTEIGISIDVSKHVFILLRAVLAKAYCWASFTQCLCGLKSIWRLPPLSRHSHASKITLISFNLFWDFIAWEFGCNSLTKSHEECSCCIFINLRVLGRYTSYGAHYKNFD